MEVKEVREVVEVMEVVVTAGVLGTDLGGILVPACPALHSYH